MAPAFYGMIPEAVEQVSAVGTGKKARFENAFGTFAYQKIVSGLMFGYDVKPLPGGRTLLFAQPEKALLDLLYLYPFYICQRLIENYTARGLVLCITL
jgi:hypothetical protein